MLEGPKNFQAKTIQEGQNELIGFKEQGAQLDGEQVHIEVILIQSKKSIEAPLCNKIVRSRRKRSEKGAYKWRRKIVKENK